MSDLQIFDGLDQPIPADHNWALERIEEIIKESVRKKNAQIALNACTSLVQISKVSGLALAKALYLIKKNWHKYKDAGEFVEEVHSATGLHTHTIERYTKVWGMYDNACVPQEYWEEIQQRNIKEQIPIANAIYQGYDVDQDAWEKLVEAPDFSTVSKIVREDITGKPPRKNTLQLQMDDIGSIWGLHQGNRYFIGSLEVSDEEEIVQKAIERIKKGAGIME